MAIPKEATHSATGGVAITKSDTTVLEPFVRALYIGGTGDVAVRFIDGTTVTFSAVPVGILQVEVDQVLSTGTTATNIIGLY